MPTAKTVTQNTPRYTDSETGAPCFTAVEDMFGWHIRHNGSIIRTGYDKDTAEAVAFRLNEVLSDA